MTYPVNTPVNTQSLNDNTAVNVKGKKNSVSAGTNNFQTNVFGPTYNGAYNRYDATPTPSRDQRNVPSEGGNSDTSQHGSDAVPPTPPAQRSAPSSQLPPPPPPVSPDSQQSPTCAHEFSPLKGSGGGYGGIRYQVRFRVDIYAVLVFLVRQIKLMLRFFLARNINIARDRTWAYIVRSRAKGPGKSIQKSAKSNIPRMVLRWAITTALLPFDLYTFIGIKSLHRPYFEAKKMTPPQISVFVAERKWDYRTFAFTAALLGLGLAFSISNRVGAAMWDFDAEKKLKGGKSQ